MTQAVSGSSPLPPLPPSRNSPTSVEDIASYLEVKNKIEVLSVVLSVAETAQFTSQASDSQQTFSQWLNQHKMDGGFSGSYSQAQNLMSQEKGRVRAELDEVQGEKNNLNLQMSKTMQDIQKAVNPRAKKELEDTLSDLKHSFSALNEVSAKLENHFLLLNELKIQPSQKPNEFSIKGPPNWENLLAEFSE